MLVIHAYIDSRIPCSLNIWAETSKRINNKTSEQVHPFAVDTELLKETIRTLSNNTLSARMDSELVTLLLPSTKSEPLPSKELILDEPLTDIQPDGLSPWKIYTIKLDSVTAFEFLTGLAVNPPPGIIYGTSFRYWIEVSKFGLELIVQQAFIPAIQSETSTQFQSRWEIYLDENNRQRLNKIANMMPPICRAFMVPSEKNNELQPCSLLPHELVSIYLNQIVDSYVRKIVSNVDLFRKQITKMGKSPDLTEQWVSQLITRSEGKTFLKADEKKINTFGKELGSWLNQIKPVESPSSFRTCFRIESPEISDENLENITSNLQPVTGSYNLNWHITFHLQARDDPSLLIPASKIWSTKTPVFKFLNRQFENPQERLLEDLGKASRIYQQLDDALQTATPTMLTLNSDQVYTFLREAAPLLQQSGFGVILPAWWQKKSAKATIKLKVREKSTGGGVASGLFGLHSLVEYDWTIAIGEHEITKDEFMKLVELKIPLVKVRGQWVEIKKEDIEKAITYFDKKHANNEMTLGEMLNLTLGGESSETGLSISDIKTDGWIKEFMEKLNDEVKLTELNAPKTFNGELRPYQKRGLSWLVFHREFGTGACLADDMGLGKTIQLIAFLLHDYGLRNGRKLKTLLICPMSIVGNWLREIQRFAPSLKVLVHHGTERLSGEEFKEEVKKHDIVITTYSLVHRDEEHLSEIEWDYIVLDEAQNIKNPWTKQCRAIKNLRGGQRIALTGTPIENRLSELWSIMDFLNPGYLGSATVFKEKYGNLIEKYHNMDTAEKLKKVVQPFILRRLKTDRKIIQDLPEKMEMKVLCNLTKEQATLYEAVVDDMIDKIEKSEGISRKGLVLSALMKLKQICNHPAQFLHDNSSFPGRSGKVARLEEMLEEALAEGDKSLIFTQFAEMGEMLKKYLQEKLGCEVLYLHGGTSKKHRDFMIQRFQSGEYYTPVFILSLKAGGLGLNLTAANHVFHFDRWWNPAVENQATDRVFRIGQKKNVQVHKFVSVGTLEEKIDMMIEQKKGLAEQIIGTGEGWLTELSTEHLKEIFKLSKDAIGGE